MGAGTGSPIGNPRNIEGDTLLRLARKRYEDTREGTVRCLIDTSTIMCPLKHPLDEDQTDQTDQTG